MKGRENVGSTEAEMLIADTTFPVDVVTVTLEKTDQVETLERGTVLAAESSTGKCKAIRQLSNTSSYAAYVLADAVETSDKEETVGSAYQTGKFVRQALKTAEDYELNQGDFKALRDSGIYVESAMM